MNSKKVYKLFNITVTRDYLPEFNSTLASLEIEENIVNVSYDIPSATDQNIEEGGDDQICYYLISKRHY